MNDEKGTPPSSKTNVDREQKPLRERPDAEITGDRNKHLPSRDKVNGKQKPAPKKHDKQESSNISKIDDDLPQEENTNQRKKTQAQKKTAS